jgi:hypothetical protein
MTMAATRTQPKRAAAARGRTPPEHRRRTTAQRAEQVSTDVFEEIEAGQRAAIQAVKKFIDVVDHALPPQTEGPSSRQTVVDAAMDMADRLVHVQYDFLRKVVHSAGKSVRER